MDSPKRSILKAAKSITVKTLSIGAIYSLGYFQVNPLWLLVPIALLILEHKQESIRKLRQQNPTISPSIKKEEWLNYNKKYLPSAWAIETDSGHCEWFNKILSQLWPSINLYVMKVLKSKIEPIVNEKLSAFVKDSFKFEILSLGSVSPVITGLKIYDKNPYRKEIVMDFMLFYAGDCDFSFMFLGLSGGIQNFQIEGSVRIAMKPTISSSPLVGGIDIYFLKTPDVEFNLVGMVNVLDMPGLSGKVRKIITDQISLNVVKPNKVHISLTNDVYSLDFDSMEIEGVLCANIIEAKDLENKDVGFLSKGKSDPYVIVSVGEQVVKSNVVVNSLNPKWDFWSEFIIDAVYDDDLLVQVVDEDDIGQDSSLGRISIDIGLVKQKKKLDTWVKLEKASRGMIHLNLTFFVTSSSLSDCSFMKHSHPFTFVLLVYIDSAQNLMKNWSLKKNNESYVQLSVGNKVETSKTVSSNSPIFKEVFKFIVKNPEIEQLHLKLIDKMKNKILREKAFALKEILNSNHMEILGRVYSLGSTESKILLSLKLRSLKSIN